VAVIVVSFTTLMAATLVTPNPTSVAPVNPVPVIVTDAPEGPLVGLIPVTTGAGTLYVYCAAATLGELPLGVVTVTSTAPVPGGAIAPTMVSLYTWTFGDATSVVPKVTVVVPVKPEP
jgi:hypothetical protein